MNPASSVLLVEDDRWLADSFMRTLAKAGYQVKLAENTLEALESADADRPDAIMLDM